MTAQDTAAIVKGIAPVILQVVSSAVAPLQVEIAALKAQLATVKDGRDGEKGEPGAPGAAGKDAEVDIDALVEKILALIPTPKDGETGAPGLNGKDGADGKDGIGLAGTLIDKSGALVVTLSDGTVRELGPVVGKDGEKGADGLQGVPGANGLHGKDGTLENIYPVLEGRTLIFKYHETDTPVFGWSMKLPMLLDQGVYSSEKAYETGDVTSYGGSAWICKQSCQGQQPGTDAGADFWRLAVKRGNDGKPGTKGLDGKDGKQGLPGRDGTRTY